MGGFEGADHVNGSGLALDLVASTGHLDRLEEDHRRAAQAGIRCVRESVGWRLSESAGGVIDLRRALRTQASAHRHGLQVLWTLMHYGLPADLSLHDDAIIERLARFAREAARVLGPGERAAGHTPVFTPVNEISYLAWAAAQPTMFAPPNNLQEALVRQARADAGEAPGDIGYAAKRRLATAAIQAMHAIRAELPEARFMHVEPLVHVVAPQGRDDLADHAALVRSWQWQAWDLLAGTLEPSLGGTPAWLDIVGVNHYHNSQWVVGTDERLDWARRDPRRRRFGLLLAETAQRYARPLVVSETSHVGVGRAAWLHEIAAEVRVASESGVQVLGLCVYPLVDRPDWQHPAQWHRSGLWHVDERDLAGARTLRRYAEPESLAALRQWQHADAKAEASTQAVPQRRPVLLAFSHRRWDSVRHRSRQLLQRLAGPTGDWHLVFVEEPLPCADPPRLTIVPAGPHIHVLVPNTPGAALQPGFCSAQQPVLQGLLSQGLKEQGLDVSSVWLSTPMAWPLARALLDDLPWSPGPRRVFYDCADELAAFQGAPPVLRRHEEALLCAADGVVCATESLAAPRRAVAGARLTLLANGWEPGVFSRASRHRHGWDAMEAAALAAHVMGPHPRPQRGPQLGYAGVIDERIDLALLAAVARARPQWHIVLIGPVLNVDPETLPRGPNLHWLGEQPYRLLPALMSRWRVAVLPFVDSAATRPGLPLKVLEALGAGLPVVATPLPELRGWRDAGLHCAAGVDAFVVACESVFAEPAHTARARQARAQARLRSRSWDITAVRLASWMQSRVGQRSAQRSSETLAVGGAAM